MNNLAIVFGDECLLEPKTFQNPKIWHVFDRLIIFIQAVYQLFWNYDLIVSLQFYAEVAEAESWINERIPILTNADLGKDEDSVQALLKKLDALDLDIDNFNNNIGELAALSQGLVQRGHFDSKNIADQQTEIEARYREIQDLTSSRRAKLMDNKKLFEFFREADEVSVWIKEREVIAASEDYGTDVEHVQVSHNDLIFL